MSSKIRLSSSTDTDYTLVSNVFIDEYLKEANGEYVKVYLLLLRELSKDNTNFSVSKMADALDHTEKDIVRALRYFEKKGLLSLDFDMDGNLSGICLLSPVKKAEKEEEEENVPVKQISLTIAPKRSSMLSMASSANAFVPEIKSISEQSIDDVSSDDAYYEVFHVAEHYMGRPLSKKEVETFMYWIDGLSMSPQLISYLVESCIEAGKNSVSYMNSIALSWAENGIHTVDEASAQSLIYPKTCFSVMKAFGIKNRSLNDSELALIDKWSKEYAFSDDIIMLACEKTIDNTGKASFRYADAILSDWHNRNVKSINDIARLDNDRLKSKNNTSEKKSSSYSGTNSKSHNFAERDYDFEALQKKLLQNS